MTDLLLYLLKQRTATQTALFPDLDEYCQVQPTLDASASCTGAECARCAEACPTGAITVSPGSTDKPSVTLDLGACIACGECISTCPTGLFRKNYSSKVATTNRSALIQSTEIVNHIHPAPVAKQRPFQKSFAIRVVSTGCSACDLEVGAAGNPIFDMERFGVQVVASPRMADGLLVTGPVPRAMHDALRRTYEAMAKPRVVIAAGTCAISGGVHSNGYAEANGVDPILPVDVYIPGCPPHPWNIIHGIFLAMGRT